jgi:hypothetical protein
MGCHFGTNFFELETYDTYFTGVDAGGPKRVGKYLTEADKQDLLSRFPANGIGRVDADYNVKLVGVSFQNSQVGGLAFTVTERIGGTVDLPRDYFRFVLEGTVPGSVYSFQNMKGKAWWMREYSLSYAHQIPGISFLKDFSIGASAKLLHGFGYFSIEKFDNVISTGDSADFYAVTAKMNMRFLRAGTDIFNNEQNVGFTFFPSPAGSGLGFDAGIAFDIDKHWGVGISVTDIGKMSWKSNAIETVLDSAFTITNFSDQAQRDSLVSAMKGRENAIGGFNTPLPTALHIGLVFHLSQTFDSTTSAGSACGMLFALDYNQGFNNMPGNTTKPRFSIGAEYKPLPWLPIRTGISFLGTDDVNWALGIGLNFHNFDVDLSTENFSGIIAPTSAKRQSVAFGMKVRI